MCVCVVVHDPATILNFFSSLLCLGMRNVERWLRKSCYRKIWTQYLNTHSKNEKIEKKN